MIRSTAYRLLLLFLLLAFGAATVTPTNAATPSGPSPTPTPTPPMVATPTQTATSAPTGARAGPTPPPTSAPSGSPTTQRTIPTLTEILAASEYLSAGDIPVDSSTTQGKTALYVATNGNDSNSGLTINAPKRNPGAAITDANNNPSTPFVIYLRGGTYYRQNQYEYLEIQRGNLMITAYPGEQVTIRPDFWPNNPTDWGEQVFLYSWDGLQDITISDLILEGWDTPFMFGADWSEPAMKNLVIRNITAKTFRGRFSQSSTNFFSTGYVGRSFFPGGATTFDPNAPGIKYQIEGLILSNISIEDVGTAVNIGDEDDANVKGLRISRLELRNAPQSSGGWATDGIAVVNSVDVLIDHCIVDNTGSDGIDCKAFDVCLVNTYVHGTYRNGVKFWRNGEVINSIIYDCTPINDGAFIIEEGPFRIINSVLMKKSTGYAGGMNWPNTSSQKLEIVNSVFYDLANTFYAGTSNLQSKNSLYNMNPGIFSGQTSAATITQLNNLSNCSGNISGNPLFTNPQGEDFTLQGTSVCRDAGIGTGVLLPSFDYYGRYRPQGAGYDIGPCEFYASTNTPSPTGTPTGPTPTPTITKTPTLTPTTTITPTITLTPTITPTSTITQTPTLTPRRVNFQPPGAATPSGFLPDGGASYGTSGPYGWQ